VGVIVHVTLAIVLAYLIGSVPFAFLLARRGGVDLRAIGSGNVGAANVLRAAGARSATVAMALDIAKGALAVLVARGVTDAPTPTVVAGVTSIVGHVYPVWLGFRGGKGVATAAGVFGVLAPVAVTVAAAVFVGTIWVTRFISAGSLAASVAFAATATLTDTPRAVVLGAAASVGLILFRHRDNMARLRSGTERRIGLRLFGPRA
jgi:glycerol-3-phosphate acyltransferase PlsY